MDAWSIYGNEGLLEIQDTGHQSFTVNDAQYDLTVKDSHGVLTQFTINPGRTLTGGSYVINESGILVGSKGLHIINNSGANRIVFQSSGDNWVNLLGSIQVNGNQAELVFISPYKINCNGCNFPGVTKVTFCTLPVNSPLKDDQLQNNPATYCKTKEELYLNSRLDVKEAIETKLAGLRSGMEHWVKWGFKEGKGKPPFNDEEYLSVNTDVRDAINNRSYLGSAAEHFTNTFLMEGRSISNNHNLYIGSKGLLSSSVDLNIIAGNVKAIGPLNLFKIGIQGESLLEFHNKVHSNTEITMKHAIRIFTGSNSEMEAPGKIHLEASRLLDLHGKVRSGNSIYVKSIGLDIYQPFNTHNLNIDVFYTTLFGGKVEAQNIFAIMDNNLHLNPGSVFKSYGTLTIEASNGQPNNNINVISSEFGAKGDATIRTIWLNVRKSGDLITNLPIPEASNGNHPWDGKWAIAMKCHKEVLSDNVGPESKVIIGGNLKFQGSKIENRLSKFVIGGSRTNEGNSYTVVEDFIQLKKVGIYDTECTKRWGEGECVAAAKARMAEYCGIHFDEHKYGYNQVVTRVYDTISSPVTDHYGNALSEFGDNFQTPSVNYDYNNHDRKPFSDHYANHGASPQSPCPPAHTAQNNQGKSSGNRHKYNDESNDSVRKQEQIIA